MIGIVCPIQQRKKGYGGTGRGRNEAVSAVTASPLRGDYARDGVFSKLKGKENLYDTATGWGETWDAGDFGDSI
jgi:hypothetical protein